MERIMNRTDPAQVAEALAYYGADYAFIGQREKKYPYVKTLTNTTYFKEVYDRNGVKIYEIRKIKNI
jgi:uncharacterized membrane protein